MCGTRTSRVLTDTHRALGVHQFTSKLLSMWFENVIVGLIRWLILRDKFPLNPYIQPVPFAPSYPERGRFHARATMSLLESEDESGDEGSENQGTSDVGMETEGLSGLHLSRFSLFDGLTQADELC